MWEFGWRRYRGLASLFAACRSSLFLKEAQRFIGVMVAEAAALEESAGLLAERFRIQRGPAALIGAEGGERGLRVVPIFQLGVDDFASDTLLAQFVTQCATGGGAEGSAVFQPEAGKGAVVEVTTLAESLEGGLARFVGERAFLQVATHFGGTTRSVAQET